MKYFNKIMLTLKLLTLIILTSVTAQENVVLDRVPEVEAELRKDIIDHVARLIPKESFSVSIKIIPLVHLYKLRLKGKKDSIYFFPSENIDPAFGILAKDVSKMGDIVEKRKKDHGIK